MITGFPVSGFLNFTTSGALFAASQDENALLSIQFMPDGGAAVVGGFKYPHQHNIVDLSGVAAASHTHTLESIGAAAASHTHTPASIGAAAASHTHTPASIGAAAASHTHTPASIGAAAASHTHGVTKVFRYQGSGASSSRSFGVSPEHTVREVQIYRDNLGLVTHWIWNHSTTLLVFPALYYFNVVHVQSGNWQVDFFDAALVSKFEASGMWYDVVIHSD